MFYRAIAGGLLGWIDSAALSLVFWGGVAGAMIGTTIGMTYLSDEIKSSDNDKFDVRPVSKIDSHLNPDKKIRLVNTSFADTSTSLKSRIKIPKI